MKSELKTKKILSFMLVFVLLLGLFSESMSDEAGGETRNALISIHEVNIYGFRAPVVGSTPEFSYKLYAEEDSGYFIVYQYWHDNTLDQDMFLESTPFEQEHLYSAGCIVSPKEGYAIAEDCIYRINGSVQMVDSSYPKPHPYLDGSMIVQSIGVQCAEEESEPKVTLSPKSYVYDGKRKKPTVTVKVGKTVLKKGRDYTVAYENNLNAGIAKAIVTLKGKYSGTAVGTFRIRKAAQEVQVTVKTGTVKYRKVQREAQEIPDLITVTGAKGTVTYNTASGPKYLSIGETTGIITVRKGTPKGTYRMKVTVTVKGTKNYLKNRQTVTVQIRVK